jgi:hypothetical protein
MCLPFGDHLGDQKKNLKAKSSNQFLWILDLFLKALFLVNLDKLEEEIFLMVDLKFKFFWQTENKGLNGESCKDLS